MASQLKELDPVNITVGKRLRLKRELAGLSQSALGNVINVSRIKIGHYESGQSAIPASKLYELSKYFNVDLCFFFSGDDVNSPLGELEKLDPIFNKVSISLLKDYNALDNPEVRRTFAAVIERAAELIKEKRN
ncbi:putative Transcriptional regulator, XRE family [Candidatus Terasakiella magnetica]|uniref:Putative Transcriptional regulator, XRE family n=1 Tax=Candidatus Terasakiella magnetica TaxID=1867952 RepID=A0A1C3RIW1_9PROT|nr:helix-turn-helix transcriptional regulator [Candidatus Terasakiella magnetica]SCA57174.1 putative Transcriptional regulator, XRE family [Candidatus Terasakiella magnetica]